MLSSSYCSGVPDRHGHTYQIGGGEEEATKSKVVVERTEAVHHILGIMRKLRVPWQRRPQQLSGWKDSL
jgi:hypothetical protein